MRLLKNLLGTVIVLMIAVITFFTWNLISSLVSNYQSLTMTSISSLPMVMFMIELFVILFAVFDHIVLKRKDAYYYRKYSLILASFAIVGIVTSILDGTIVYHTFVGDYIFIGFPLFMLIIHTTPNYCPPEELYDKRFALLDVNVTSECEKMMNDGKDSRSL